eukprot:s2093_g5.t1
MDIGHSVRFPLFKTNCSGKVSAGHSFHSGAASFATFCTRTEVALANVQEFANPERFRQLTDHSRSKRDR